MMMMQMGMKPSPKENQSNDESHEQTKRNNTYVIMIKMEHGPLKIGQANVLSLLKSPSSDA